MAEQRWWTWSRTIVVLMLMAAAGSWVSCRPSSSQEPASMKPASPVGILAASDEPPIRVKGGSIDLEASYDSWQGSGMNWKPTRDRGKDPLDIVVLYNSGATCRGQYVSADQLDVEYTGTDNARVTLKSTGNHLQVNSDKILTRKGRTLTYGTPHQGYISAVYVDGQTKPFCTFLKAEDLDQILILDW